MAKAPTPTLYVQRKPVLRWKRAARDAKTTFAVFSPYVTMPTAKTVLLASKSARQRQLFTLFESETFITGASSLNALRRLQDGGVQLFAVPNLHAKIVISPDRFASIGSQNLTGNGSRKHRLEATAAFTSPSEVNAIWAETGPWRDIASPISKTMIDDMERFIRPFRRKAKRFKKRCAEIDTAIERQERERNDARKRTASRWNNTLKSRRIVLAMVATVPQSNGRSIVTLRPRITGSLLTHWRLEDETNIVLDRCTCYPCLLFGTWKFGFARVAQTRITFVGQGVETEGTHLIGGKEFTIHFWAVWDGDKLKASNIAGELIFKTGATLHTSMWFDSKELDIFDPHVTKSNDNETKQLLEWFSEFKNEVQKTLLDELLSSFSYAKPLRQRKADKFFGPVGSRFLLQVGKVDDCPVIVATPDPTGLTAFDTEIT